MTRRCERIYVAVKGAPFNIGRRVRVARLTDESGDESLLGQTGVIEHYEYSCGCGQSFPADPMIGVRFRSGKIEEFWREELRLQRGRNPSASKHSRSLAE